MRVEKQATEWYNVFNVPSGGNNAEIRNHDGYDRRYARRIFADNGVDVAFMPFALDGVDIEPDTIPTHHEFYDKLRAGAVPSTSQTSAYEAIQIFEKHLQAGEDVLHISFSSGMSGSFDNISNAATELCRKYRDRKILVLDSLSGCGGEGLMVYYALKMRDEGKTIEEVYNWLNDNRMNFHHFS